MARKKKNKPKLSDNVIDAQFKLDSLIDEKYLLLKSLSEIHNEFNALSDREVKSLDAWLHELPSIEAKPQAMSTLAKVKARQSLRKNSIKMMDKIDQLESEIRIAYMDLLLQKVESALQ